MDDLLALMEDDGDCDGVISPPSSPRPGPNSSPNSSPNPSSTREESEKNVPRVRTDSNRKSDNSHPQQQRQPQRQPPQQPPQQRRRPAPCSSPQQPRLAEASIDDRIGIHVAKRILSSMELLDFITSHPYHSTASLAAMSRAALNRLLLEPASIISEATVCGTTGISMVGIVFTNSGSRISANGRAYSILSIGNLSTGGVVSIFLFGDAYGTHCTKSPPGTVILLLTPQLLASKQGTNNNNNNNISFSIRDVRQLLVVGNARDYATCKAEVRTKRAGDGQWVNHKARCNNHVDTRISLYCHTHRKQQQQPNTAKHAGASTFVQNLKSHGRPVPATRNHNPNTMVQKQIQSQTQPYARGMFAGRIESHMGTAMTMTMLTPAGPVVTHVANKNSAIPTLRAPMHMKKSEPLILNNRSTGRHTKHVATTQSYNSKLSKGPTAPNPTLQSKSRAMSGVDISKQQRQRQQPMKEDWLQLAGNKSNSQSQKQKHSGSSTFSSVVTVQPQKKKQRPINLDTLGYNGSVAVPKPNKLFRPATAGSKHLQPATAMALVPPPVEKIRERQRALARALINSNTNTSSLKTNTKKIIVVNPYTCGKQNDRLKVSFPQNQQKAQDSLLFSGTNFGNIDTEKFLLPRAALPSKLMQKIMPKAETQCWN